jgi:protein subunit release factor A
MISDSDLKIELIYVQTGTTQRPGGQHAGSPASAVRVTHEPSGIMAQCGDLRSQHLNKMICISMIEHALSKIEVDF